MYFLFKWCPKYTLLLKDIDSTIDSQSYLTISVRRTEPEQKPEGEIRIEDAPATSKSFECQHFGYPMEIMKWQSDRQDTNIM